MLKLYLDCDGVILDTINKSYDYFDKHGIKFEDQNAIRKYYQDLDWNKFIIEAGEIDNSISKIKEIIASNLYEVNILTHVNSDNEIEAKKKYFSKHLPGVNIIGVPKGIKKTDYIEAKGNILVDDYLGNLDDWYQKGGIPVKFSNRNKECRYTKITDLRDLINLKIKN